MASCPPPFPQDQEVSNAGPAAAVLPAGPPSPLDLILHVYGPKRGEDSSVALWDGMVNVLRITDSTGQPIWDYRQVFVTRDPVFDNVVLPGTIVVQARVVYVDTRIGAAPASRWVPATGSVDLIVTLLLDCPPGDWVVSGGVIVRSTRCRCVAGEIRLGDFQVQPAPDEWQRHFRKVLAFPTVLAPESFAVNSSGFALVGQANLPWQKPTDTPLPPARYQVVIPRPSEAPTLILELDRERLHVDYARPGADAEAAYTQAFSDLAGLLRPGGSDPARSLNWAGFDLDPGGGIPSFLWSIEPKPQGGGDAAIDLRLAQGVVRLTLADQRLGDPLVSPRTIATCNGTTVVRSSAANTFELNFHAERPVTAPLDGDVTVPDLSSLGGRLVQIDAPSRLFWSVGRTVSATDANMKALADFKANQPPGKFLDALNELIGSFTMSQPFAASVSGNLPPVDTEPDLKDLVAIDSASGSQQLRWIVPWMSPEAEARLTALASDTQWDVSFRQAAVQLIGSVTELPKLAYHAMSAAPGFNESIDWNAVDLEYDALGAADIARTRTGTAAPDLFSTTPVAKGAPPPPPLFTDLPFLLWGPLPTADGWAELPFFNLTEDLYLRALNLPGPDLDPPLVSGAASFGTTTPELASLPDFSNEQKWDVTLLDADVITAQCQFAFGAGAWGISQLEARFWGPELSMSGWLWVSTVPPSTEDSVPDFGPWLTALSTLDLRSPSRRELFPCPFLVRFERGGFTRSLQTVSPRTYAYPVAGGWTYQYRDNDRPSGPQSGARSVFETLLSNLSPFFPDGAPVAFPPLLWRRHPSLPAVQTLPLTQSRTPPNYPSASRQFAPFTLPLEPNTLTPGTWRFDVSPTSGTSGAGQWPTVLAVNPQKAVGPWDKIDVAAEWQTEPVVGLAYLSVPGLAGYPAKKGVAGVVDDPFLPLALAHGLPSTDEIHALAELPKAPNDNADAVAAAAVPPAAILTRETYAARWADLAERAIRAAADGEPALTTDKTGQLAARALIEPYAWNLTSAALEDARYPGRFELHAAAAGSIGLSLSRDAALAGFDGWFRVNAGALERFSPPDPTSDPAGFKAFQAARGTSSAIAVVGGAMAAVGDGMSLRDQRGLVRFATATSAVVPNEGTPDTPWRVLRTRVSLETAPGTFLDRTLATSLGAATLSLDGFGAWAFWFRDLPLSGTPDEATTYARSDTGDPLFREDVNDPTALGRNYLFRAGYEWRLFDPKSTDGVPRLGILICHPLTLESLVFDTDGTGKPLDTVNRLEVVARLQLPISGTPIEEAQSSNAARLIFNRHKKLDGSSVLRLEEIDIAPTNMPGLNVPPELIWPLSGATGAPRLRMVDRGGSDRGIKYQADNGTTPATLTVARPTVDFPVLDTIWSPRANVAGADTLTITPSGPSGTISWSSSASGAATFVESVNVRIDGSKNASHELALTVAHRWGRQPSQGEIVPPLGVMLRQPVQLLGLSIPAQQAHVYLGDDLNGLELTIAQQPDTEALFNTRSVFVSWAGYVTKAAPGGGGAATAPQVLPGMPLAQPIGSGTPDNPPPNTIRGFAGLTFAAQTPVLTETLATGQVLPTQQQLDPLLVPRLTIDAAGNTLRWTGLQFNASEEQALFALAANAAFGADFRSKVQDLLGAIRAATPQFSTVSGFAEVLFPCQWGESLQQPKSSGTPSALAVFGSSAGRVDMGYTVRFGFAQDVPWSHDLLLNGWIEIKNLVSWPILQGDELKPSNVHFTFPPARPPGTALGHLRHTARVLLNQIAVADKMLQAGALQKGEPLLVVADGFALQFVAVVEHRLSEIALVAGTSGTSNSPPPNVNVTAAAPSLPGTGNPPPPPSISGVTNERGWTVVQEVRLSTPGVFAAFLRELSGFLTSHMGFMFNLIPLPVANLGYQRGEVLQLLAPDLEAVAANPNLARRFLIVEASVPVSVNPDDWPLPGITPPPEPFAPLQYLPMGTQRAILSAQIDFSSGRTKTSEWVYVGLPFLGRLQDPAGDGTTNVNLPAAGESRLRLDPILHIYAQALAGGGAAPLDALPLLFASWADAAASALDFQPFDVVPGQAWARLDPATLEESWFRVLSGALDPPPASTGSPATGAVPTAGSVLAALPADSPGRLSRADALITLIDPNRANYPPSLPPAVAAATASANSPPSSTPNFVWGQGALFVLQRLINAANADPHGFALTGKRLFQLDRLGRTDPASKRRLPAVTLLPPPLSPGANPPPSFPHPVSFAVSPYLGIDYVDASSAIPPTGTPADALFGELLALDRAGVRVIVVATKLFVASVATDSTGAKTVVQPSNGDLMNWAMETYRRLAPDSPFAVLRRRGVFKPASSLAGLIIDYAFIPFRDTERAVIAKTPPQPVRAELAQLRFADGQRNRAAPPARALPVELAPPQTADVQPLRRVEEKPWGFSGLRFEFSVSSGSVGTVGIDDARLWWQNCQHFVQFAPPLPDGVMPPLGGGGMGQQAGRLPKLYRARAIRALVPAVPDLTMPDASNLPIIGPGDAPLSLAKAAALEQATLPGAVRCTVIGGRAGVSFAFRPHVIVQHLPTSPASGTPTAPYNCGAVPVQHRAPRPLPLPPNHLAVPSPETARPFRQDIALDVWGSWFDLGNLGDPPPSAELRTTIASAVPRDDSFFQPDAGPMGLDVAWPNGAGIPPGLASIDTSIALRLTPEGKGTLAGWHLSVALVLSVGRFDLGAKLLAAGDTSLELPLPTAAQAALGTLPHGDPVQLDVTVSAPLPPSAIQGYHQTLPLSSLLRRTDGPMLPLQPVYALFDDPDYSRSLATPTSRKGETLRNPSSARTVLTQLAADRREYNPGTPVFFAFFTDDSQANLAQTFGRLAVYRIFARNVAERLAISGPFPTAPANPPDVWIEGNPSTVVPPAPGPGPPPPPFVWIAANQIYRLHADNRLAAGDTLELQLDSVSIGQTPQVTLAGNTIIIDLSITDRPVTPPPQSAYALLRTDTTDGVVSCVRFAWSPEASRIDLINPDDLRTEVVRRRAVFRWTDVVRPPLANSSYAVQKLTTAGSMRTLLSHFEAVSK
jgi:hypothetical protein